MGYLHSPLHKPTGQAVVTLDGRDIYLGRRLPASVDLTVNELLLAYLRHAEGVLPRWPVQRGDAVKLSLRPVRQLYGHTLARDFGPLARKAVREVMIESACPAA